MDSRSQQIDDDVRGVLDGFRNLVQTLRLADQAGIKEHGLGTAQLFVLHQLGQKAPLSINELAALTSTDQSSVSAVVNKLAAKGLVVSGRSEHDGRRVELVLTPSGRATLALAPPPFQNSLIRIIRQLPPEKIGELARMLQHLAEATGIDDGPPPMFFEEHPGSKS